MELLLTNEIEQPTGGSGLIIGTRVQAGKFLITHFVSLTKENDHETIIGYCEQIATRLIGGVEIVGCYNETNSLLSALKEFTPHFVAVLFEDKITAKMYAGNKVSRSEVKHVQSSKYPIVLVRSRANVNFSLGTDNLEYNKCHAELQKKIEKLSDNLRVTYDGTVGTKSDLIFPKTSKSYPNEIMTECYFSKCEPSWSNSKSLISLKSAISLFGILSPKSTYNDLTECLRDDLKRSMICRLSILEEQILDQVKDENVETLFSSAPLPKRVNYELNTVPVSLYQSSTQPASSDLADFFGISETSKLFDYVEEDILEDEYQEVNEDSGLNKPIMALLVLIISLLIAIFLQS